MPKILLAEDDFTMVKLLTTLLNMEGFEVMSLDVHSDVPALVERESADALLMDVHLGEQSGVEIVRKIRKNRKSSRIKIIMTSGLNMKEECIAGGADHFLMKPFMPDDLIQILKNDL